MLYQISTVIVALLALTGAFLNAQKRMACWNVWLLQNSLWIVLALRPLNTGLILQNAVFIVINIYARKKWKE